MKIAEDAVVAARKMIRDTVIIDTAGRMHVDEEMMREVESIRAAVKPDEILFVVDAMTGQDAVNTAKAFHERLNFDGVVLTKLDGDSRGGAALSIRSVVHKPIKFIGIGEKLDALEPFYPERIASRILGMGDIVTLVEKAQQQFSEEKAVRSARCALAASTENSSPTRRMRSTNSDLDLVYVGNEKDIVMYEGAAKEISEADFNAALQFGQECCPAAHCRAKGTRRQGGQEETRNHAQHRSERNPSGSQEARRRPFCARAAHARKTPQRNRLQGDPGRKRKDARRKIRRGKSHGLCRERRVVGLF